MSSSSNPGFLARIVDWLRAGYPDGVPSTDYQPLLALLDRQLTKEELREMLLHASLYAGIPAAVEGFRLSKRWKSERFQKAMTMTKTRSTRRVQWWRNTVPRRLV